MSHRKNSRESGFALILALLSLALLTSMGLALANNTGVELQIATNQRWGESARYNAEAGIEYGKRLLLDAPDWGLLLPAARVNSDWDPTAWSGSAPSVTPMFSNATRNFENFRCDKFGFGMGYGVVLDDGGALGPQEYISEVAGATLNGAFTLWIRRPVMWSGGNSTGTTLQDHPDDDVIMLVSEGVAPYTGAAANATGLAALNRSTFVIETLLTRKGAPVLDQSACNTRQGQAGGSSSGGNTAGCVALTEGRQITEALGDTPGAGTGVLK
jgi:hypothetical protein